MNWHRMLETCREIEEQFGLVLSPQARPADDLMEDQWLLSIRVEDGRREVKMFITEALMENAQEHRYLVHAIGRKFLYMIHNPGSGSYSPAPVEIESRDLARWAEAYIPPSPTREAKPFA